MKSVRLHCQRDWRNAEGAEKRNCVARMSTRSKITWVVIGVMIGIALLVFIRWMRFRNTWWYWPEVALTGLMIVSLIIHGRAEIFKIVWLGKAERSESASSKRRTRSMPRASAPPTDAIPPRIKPRITSEAKHDERIQS